VPDAVLTDLKQRAGAYALPRSRSGSGWDYGTSPAYLQELVTCRRTAFDWRAAKRRLNQLDQFTANIDGRDSLRASTITKRWRAADRADPIGH